MPQSNARASRDEKRWNVEFHADFSLEFRRFPPEVQDVLLALLIKLRQFGPQLGRPDVDTLKGSRYSNMKELRLTANDSAWRIAFAFDPDRRAILLVGGSKSGISKDRFYRSLIHEADSRFQSHLFAAAKESIKK